MGISIKKIILLTFLFISTSLSANIAKVVALKGEATILREGKNISLTRESVILKHDEIKTNKNTKVQLLFKDNTIVSIGQDSSFQIFNYLFDEKNKKFEAKFSMLKGTFRTITGKIGKIAPKKFNLKTKSASIGIRGTQVVMNISNTQEQIFCTEGKILISKNDSNITSLVNAGEFVSFKSNEKLKFNVRKIKQSDIKKINKTISIQNNLATDNITIKKQETKETLNIQQRTTRATEVSPSTVKESSDSLDVQASPQEEQTETTETTNLSTPTPTIVEPTIVKEEKNNTTKLVKEEKPKPTKPEPTEPEPTEPEPTEPEPTEPEPTEPDPTEPEPTEPDPTEPDPTEPEPTEPEPTEPEPTEPEPTEPEPTEPDPTEPDPTEPEPTEPEPVDDLSIITPDSYFENNNSTATYRGNFNNHSFDDKKQYMKNINKDKVAIPTGTSISMDIDFGATKDHVSNGEVVIPDVGDSTSRTIEFDGRIHDDHIHMKADKGSDTKGHFYGSQAQVLEGSVNMETSDKIEIKGKFDSTKQ